MAKIIIGIDTGLDGGIAILCPHKDPIVLVTPVLDIKCAGKTKKGNNKTKREYFINEIVSILKPYADRNDVHAFVEKAGCMPSQSAQSGFQTGRGFGMLEGIIAALGIPITTPLPQQWQKVMIPGQAGQTKARSISVAVRMFPKTNFKKSDRCTTYHDGMTDAVLIAEWGRRELK